MCDIENVNVDAELEVSLTRLFVPKVMPIPPWANSEGAELDAVEGRKGVCFVSCELDLSPGSTLQRLSEDARQRGLLLIIKQVRGFDDARAYLCRPDAVWQVLAHHALNDRVLLEGEGSLRLEALNSHFLGYSDDEISEWVAWRAWESIVGTSGGKTAFFIISDAQRQAIVEEGSRRLPPEAFGEGLLMAITDGSSVPRTESATLLGAEYLARVAIEPGFFDDVRLGKADAKGLRYKRVLDEGMIRVVNARMMSNIEVLEGTQWTDSRVKRLPLRHRALNRQEA